ncbi:MAG: hypothetical protein RMI34_05890, partial [Chloroherpetonaceae bacterium]|nr:hypothetical protein [Chloroherpetonaceae bacterium]
VAANYIARWNGTKWNTLGAGNQNGVNSRVNALAVYNNELYVGGSFTQAGSIQANRIARWNGTKWNALGTGDQNGVSSDDATLTAVYALAVYQGELYVGGFFGQAGSVPASFIARWNGASWSALTTPTGNGVNSSVDALAVYGNSLFLGGALTLANAGENPIPSAYIAQWTFRN